MLSKLSYKRFLLARLYGVDFNLKELKFCDET